MPSYFLAEDKYYKKNTENIWADLLMVKEKKNIHLHCGKLSISNMNLFENTLFSCHYKYIIVYAREIFQSLFKNVIFH